MNSVECLVLVGAVGDCNHLIISDLGGEHQADEHR